MSDAPQSLDLSFLRERAVLKRIAIVTLAFAVVGLLYGLLAPKWYRSVLTVVPTKPQKTGVSGLLGMDLGGLAGSLDSALGGADAPRIAAVLQSIAVSDAVVEKFDLRTRYGASYQETAREVLWNHCDVKVLPKPGLVQLSCEDRDPKFVQQMLAYFSEYGNEVFRRVSGGVVEWQQPFEKEGLRLLGESKPSANMPAAERAQHVNWALDQMSADGWWSAIVDDRVAALERSHKRLRTVVKAKALTVTPHPPPDILGCYVLVPAKGRR